MFSFVKSALTRNTSTRYIFFVCMKYNGKGRNIEKEYTYSLFYIDTNISTGYDGFIICSKIPQVISSIIQLDLNKGQYLISSNSSGGNPITLGTLINADNIIGMFFINNISNYIDEFKNAKNILNGGNIKDIIDRITRFGTPPEEIIIESIPKNTNTFHTALESLYSKGKNPYEHRFGGNKYDKYTLKELKQIAIKNKIKITKMVVISNDELHKKLKDKNIIINKKIKLEDFKRILIENNIKITKRVNLTKQELIKKLEI